MIMSGMTVMPLIGEMSHMTVMPLIQDMSP